MIKYLGHIIRPEMIEVEEVLTSCLSQLRHPKTPTKLRRFFELCNVYRRFIRNYSYIASSLYAILKGKQLPKELEPCTENQYKAFLTLIKAMAEPPILALPRPGLPYSIDTYACTHQVRCALFQMHEDGTRKPIVFWSRSLP